MTAILREAARGLARSPLFTVTTVLSLGAGIGLATSVFAVARAAFLAPLPYPEPERLVEVLSTPRPGSAQAVDYLTAERAAEWTGTEIGALSALAGGGNVVPLVTSGPDGATRVDVEPLLGDWFGVLGAAAARGRVLTADDARPGAPPAAVVSHGFAEGRLAGRGDVLGRTLDLSGTAFTVVGVMPPAFQGGERVWVAAASLPEDRRPGAYLGVGRLRAGATVAQAAGELSRRAAAQVAADSARWAGYGATARSLGEAGRRAEGRPVFWILAGVVAAVLLIGLTNLATLFGVRARGRAGELAVRASLGAGTWQLGSRLAAEGLVVGLGAAALGLLLARWGKDAVRVLVRGDYHAPGDPALGLPAAALALGLGLAVALLVGLEPLRRLRTLEVAALLRGATPSATGEAGERWRRNVLVASQVAACVVLVAVTAVLAGAWRTWAVLDVGYDAAGVVVAVPDYELQGTEREAQWTLARQVVARLRERPEVAGVALWRGVYMPWPGGSDDQVVVDGVTRELGPWERVYSFYEVAPGTVAALGVDLVRGRDFTAADGPGAPPVGIVNAGLAAAWWPGQDPLGRQLRLGAGGAWVTVVGVVEDTQAWRVELARGVGRSLRGEYWPVLLLPAAQWPTFPAGWQPCPLCAGVTVGVRAAAETGEAARALRQELTAAAPGLPVPALGTMLDLQMGDHFPAQIALGGRLVAAGSAVGLFLAVLGIVGVVADGVGRRRREIGVRVALGARARHVLGVVAAESALTAAAGLAAGLAALVVLRDVVTRLFLPAPVQRLEGGLLDPAVLLPAAALVLAVSLVAALAAARRALRVEPAEALRSG